MAQVYCVKCRAKVEGVTLEPIVLKNGRDAGKGKCPTCDSAVYRMGKVS